MLFDTHAHLNDEQYQADIEEVIDRAHQEGVMKITVVGYDLSSSRTCLKIAEKYPGIYAAVGIHPQDAEELDENALKELEEMAQAPCVVAIGEIGLDYYRDASPRAIQQNAFRRQIQLAKKIKKPIIIHDREAHGDTIRILREEQAGENSGILHCFSGSWEMAKECMELGFYISFAGPVTYKNAAKLPEVAKLLPLDRLLIETDCPYLSPHPYRGKRNEPSRVKLVAEKIAQIKEIPYEVVAEAAAKNAYRVFGISEQ